MKATHDKTKLEAFFREVAQLTKDHDCIGDYASVSPAKLGAALEKVDPEWWSNTPLPVDDDDSPYNG